MSLDEHTLLRDSLRSVLARICPPAAVRAAWSEGLSRERWRELARAGVLGLLISEEHGGQGLGEVELGIVLEEVGRAALPEPVLESAAVAAALLTDRRWLAAIAAGEAVVTVGLGGRPVLEAAEADLLILEDATGLHALERAAVTVAPLRSVDGARRLYQVTWRAADGVPVADRDGAARGALAASSILVGMARRMLEMTVDYVKLRHQFGRPVGSFQAVKHHLANALGRVELAAPVVRRAAQAVAAGEPAWHERASMAKACASDAASFVARIALQCHGAIGYAFEHDLQLWMKRTWALAATWGDAAWHRARLAEAVLDHGLDLEEEKLDG